MEEEEGKEEEPIVRKPQPPESLPERRASIQKKIRTWMYLPSRRELTTTNRLTHNVMQPGRTLLGPPHGSKLYDTISERSVSTA